MGGGGGVPCTSRVALTSRVHLCLCAAVLVEHGV